MKKSSLLSKSKYAIILKYYHHLKGMRYSDETIKVYGILLVDFLLYLKDMDPLLIQRKHVERYCQEVIIRRNLSVSYQRQFIGAVKLFCKVFELERINSEDLERPKKGRKLPVVLSPAEVINIMRCTQNLKHRAIIGMLYSAGLRVSELVNLKLVDIDPDRMMIHVRRGKGGKQRFVVISERYLLIFNNYLSTYRPKEYVFETREGNKYGRTTVNHIIKRSTELAGVKKRVSAHTFRHSFATHLLESGIDIRYIQELLGHRKLETTMIYTHVQRKDLQQIRSPLDLILDKTENRDLRKQLPTTNPDHPPSILPLPPDYPDND